MHPAVLHKTIQGALAREADESEALVFSPAHEDGRRLGCLVMLDAGDAGTLERAIAGVAAGVRQLIAKGLDPALCGEQVVHVPGVCAVSYYVHGVPVLFLFHYSLRRQRYILAAEILAGIA